MVAPRPESASAALDAKTIDLINRGAGASALTAAGMRIQRRQAEILRRLIQPWQARAYAYYDLLGEIKYAAQFYSRALSQLELFAGEFDDKGEIQPTNDANAVAALDRIRDPGGGRSSLLSAYGRLMFLAGETYLFVSKDEDGQEQWEMLSTDELRITGETYMRYKAPSMMAEDYRDPGGDSWAPVNDGDAVAYRLWQRHPRFSMLPDSTMFGVLDLCEELVLLTQTVRARARSRLTGPGVLFIDDRVSPAPPEPVGDEDPEEDIFLDALTHAMTEPITDEGTASAVVPIVVRVPVPDGFKLSDLVYHLQISDPTQLYPETGLRYEVIKRIAIGLDMPPEILLGLQDSNHWTSWMIDEQTWKSHLMPKAQQLCDDLTSAYYRPYLRSLGATDVDRFVIAYDATKVINHPDRGKDASDLYAGRAIGKAAYRAAKGFDEADAPTSDELNEMIGVAVHDGSLAVYGIPSLRTGGIEPAPGEITSGQGTEGTPAPATGAEVEPGPPANGAEPGSEAVIGAARLAGAAQLSVLRCREVAGNRLRTLAKKHADLEDQAVGVRSGVLAAKLGPEAVRRLQVTERDLVSGARDLILESLRMFMIDDSEQASAIADAIERHAAKTLYDENPSPLPSQFTNYLLGLSFKA